MTWHWSTRAAEREPRKGKGGATGLETGSVFFFFFFTAWSLGDGLGTGEILGSTPKNHGCIARICIRNPAQGEKALACPARIAAPACPCGDRNIIFFLPHDQPVLVF